MRFFVIVCNNRLYTYVYDGQELKMQYIEGNEFYDDIRTNHIADDINHYMNILADMKNLESSDELRFELIDSTDENFNRSLYVAFEDHIDKEHKLDDVLKTVLKKLQQDKKLMVDTYGINYGNFSYIMKGNDIHQSHYDLLAYSINYNDVIEAIRL